jgi:intein-encoded DNA endonuclease-like protein
LYRLDDAKIRNTKKTFYINAADFTNKQEITQTAESRMIQVAYADNKIFTRSYYAYNVTIKTFQPKGNSEINLEYSTITFNEELSFPYSVPNGYNRIIIK